MKYRPLQLSSWVDDLGHQEVGHTKLVTERAIGVSVGLVTGLWQRGFRMSDKSLLLASTTKLGLEVQSALKREGIDVQYTTAARDLGVDGHGRRRSTRVMRTRLAKAAQKTKVIKHVVKVDARARILCRTGHRPTIWGLEGQGLAPSTLRQLRGQVAGMSGCRYAGGCSTTAIRLAFTQVVDPTVAAPKQLLGEWLGLSDALAPPASGPRHHLEEAGGAARGSQGSLEQGQGTHWRGHRDPHGRRLDSAGRP